MILAVVRPLFAIVAVTVLAFAFTGCEERSDAAPAAPAAEAKPAVAFKEGQKWAYHSRPSEPNSTLTILKIDQGKGGQIAHLRIEGLKLKNKDAAGGFSDTISNLPVPLDTLKDSVTTLVAENVAPPADFAALHAAWKKDFDAGKTGLLAMPVGTTIQVLETELNE